MVVSSADYNAHRRDFIILAITSQIRQPLGFGEAIVTDWHAAGLIKPSVFKPVLATIEQSLVVRTMGSLTAADQGHLQAILSRAVGP